MPRCKRFGVLSFLLLSSLIAQATPFAGSLWFTGLQDGQAVADYYQSDGITFNGFYAVAGSYIYCLGTTETCSASVPSGGLMNVEPGFQIGLSFYFKSGSFGEVLLFDQLNGLGTQLADVTLPNALNEWEPFGFFFGGLAKSAVFNGSMEVAVLTMGGQMVVPEPGSVLLFVSGLCGLATTRLRKR